MLNQDITRERQKTDQFFEEERKIEVLGKQGFSS